MDVTANPRGFSSTNVDIARLTSSLLLKIIRTLTVDQVTSLYDRACDHISRLQLRL